MRRKPIRRQVQRMVLLLCVAALLCTGLLWAGSLFSLRSSVRRGSRGLGESAASAGGEALLAQMESNLYKGVQSEAGVVDGKLGNIAGYINDFAFYAHRLYEEPEAYVPKEVLPPNAENRYKYTLQLSLRDGGVDAEDVADEVSLLANLVHLWQPVMTNAEGSIASVYLCTESGFMINYDERSDLTDEYFDYTGASWYAPARDGGLIFTAPYKDTFGRGLILTCAAPFYDADGGFAGVVAMDVMVEDMCSSVLDISFGEGSYAFLVDSDGDIIVSPTMSYDGVFENVRDEGSPAFEAADGILGGETGVFCTTGGIYYAYTPIESASWTLVVHVPAAMITAPAEGISAQINAKTEATDAEIRGSVLRTGLVALALFFAVTAAVAALSGSFSKRLTHPLSELAEDVKCIGGGDLAHRAAARQNDEIGDLANSFNAMAASLDMYIRDLTTVTAEKERIGAELDIARNIQASMLPSIFPAFPQRKEFDIYATMAPAKEVGGDFYDFFMVDDSHIAVVMADVSGKGVPAALFMVIGKTLIKDHTSPNRDLGEVFSEVNRLLCEGNSEGMFITAFEGVLDLDTGRFDFVNAGHEMPYICRKGGTYEIQKIRPGFVLAGMEGIKYKMGSMTLAPGDKLFQYTDGVTEATDASGGFYGSARLAAVLDGAKALSPEGLLSAVKADLDAFVGDAPQFDDVTMLCLEFKEYRTAEKEITVAAAAKSIPVVTELVDEWLDSVGCTQRDKMRINVVVDEILCNIAEYAYTPGTGKVTVRIGLTEDGSSARLAFIDEGRPYDPLSNADPDTTLSADERQIGGLGIFVVKSTMDDVSYEYKEGKNILTVVKKIS